MKWIAGIGVSIGLALGIGAVQAAEWTAPALVASDVQKSGEPTLSVMTYNIEGLPFPLRAGRNGAAYRIADRLKEMRSAGLQPHVVVLQEAFGEAQHAIGRIAGYRYSAQGPDSRLANTEPMDTTDRAFASHASFFKGERLGKVMGSGLVILSDYPIVSVTRVAFPSYACAGFDCLANKGVVMAMVKVPGAQQPVAVVATHLNSKNASGVSKDRWNYAFNRQVQTIDLFLKAHLDAGTPYVLAGDLNIGKSPSRTATFAHMLAGLPRTADAGVVRTALDTCLGGTDRGCTISAPGDVRVSHARNKDWQAFAPGAVTHVALLGIDAPFGQDDKGRMLSDHIGYTAFYRLTGAETVAAAGGGERVVALR
jgi:endonuclease/exonuclease/phosphatase family metal-dependent hydrolase